ncbi:hypothetical protein L9F63_007910, partial [Diploptera punctata]
RGPRSQSQTTFTAARRKSSLSLNQGLLYHYSQILQVGCPSLVVNSILYHTFQQFEANSVIGPKRHKEEQILKDKPSIRHSRTNPMKNWFTVLNGNMDIRYVRQEDFTHSQILVMSKIVFRAPYDAACLAKSGIKDRLSYSAQRWVQTRKLVIIVQSQIRVPQLCSFFTSAQKQHPLTHLLRAKKK